MTKRINQPIAKPKANGQAITQSIKNSIIPVILFKLSYS